MCSRVFLSRLTLLTLPVVLTLTQGCGSPTPKPATSYEVSPPAVKAFAKASKDYAIPERLLIAVAYTESLINSKRASASLTAGRDLSPAVGQSAFGISRAILGLPDGEVGDKLVTQIEAYSRWVAQQVAGGLQGVTENDEDKFNWIWQLASLHRQDDSTRSLFAKELLAALNEGFHWIDPDTQAVIPFAPENPVISVEKLRAVSQNHLQLTNWILPSLDDVYSARYIARHNQQTHGKTQNPRGLTIIHCPFSLSACIDMQSYDGKEEKTFWLGAHYIIPNDSSFFSLPLQVAQHKTAVPRITRQGAMSFSEDRVVIMLTGLPGRHHQGQRMPANPSWLSSWQLQLMGKLAQSICDRLYSAHAGTAQPLTLAECLEVGKGLHFQTQEKGETFQWGDIPDFDPAIFASYILNPDLLAGKAVFEFPGAKQIFKADAGITLNLTFARAVRHIQLDRLTRCPDDERVVWTTVSEDDVRNQANYLFTKKIYDAGPNLNGSQYFRAKVFGSQRELLGWDLATVYVEDFEKGQPAVSPESCF